MGFIQTAVLSFVLLNVGFVISQEPSSEIPTTTNVTTETQSPETTIKPTSPSTTEPSTSTEPVTTTKPPLPDIGSWNITDNVTCIRAELQIEFILNLEGVEKRFPLSPRASDSGSDCQAPNSTQVLALSTEDYDLTLIFAKDSFNAFVKNVVFVYKNPQGEEIFYNSSELFKVKLGNSYQCKTVDAIHMGNATMAIYYIHIQAFGTAEENGFSTAEECEADDKVSDIIPIAVACALAALIIIVLIAYLVGRRRSRQRGYTSV